eukprot:4142069-Alexandrium_andersonii.AAC.1
MQAATLPAKRTGGWGLPAQAKPSAAAGKQPAWTTGAGDGEASEPKPRDLDMAHPLAVAEEPPPAGPVQEAPALGGTTTPRTELPPPVESPGGELAAPA